MTVVWERFEREQPELAGLLEDARARGDLGPGPLSVHLAHSLAFVDLLAGTSAPGIRLLDLGSGAGIPGLVIAACLTHLQVSLLDGRALRAHHLEVAVERLGLHDRTTVIGERAEVAGRDPSHRAQFDVVVARGFAPPGVTAECAAPFLRKGGQLIVADPPDRPPRRWPESGLAPLGLHLEQLIDAPFHFGVLRCVEETTDRYPRRTGIPAKRPLF